jgi:hypothetical protein
MTIELRARVSALKSQIEKRENAARETAHRIAKAQATYKGDKQKPIVTNPKTQVTAVEGSQTQIQAIEATERQTHIIEEVTVIAKLAEERAFKAEKKALVAQREAMFANVIALITMTISVAIFINISL